MKVLFVCHRFPFPPKRGGKIRPFNIISHLSANGHEVTVASLVRSAEEAHEGEGLTDHCAAYLMERIDNRMATARMLARLPTTTPSSMGYFYSPRLTRRIKEEMARTQYDLIFVHCSSVAQYVEDVTGIPKILDYGDMDSQKWLEYAKVRSLPLSLGYLIEGSKMERAEKKLAAKFDLCTCTTRAEFETLNNYHAAKHTAWFPNGVDYTFFRPTGEPYEPDSLCFIGRMDYYPNQECMFDFCRNILPLIREQCPNVTLTIVGADPSPAVRKLEEIPGVTVTGSVPDVRPYVLKSAVNVAPLNIARGTQNKILESMAMGVPVVASERAAGGIDAVAGEHFLQASTPREYTDAVLQLLSSPEQRQKYSHAGRERVISNHDWGASMQRLDKIVEDCLAQRKDR